MGKRNYAIQSRAESISLLGAGLRGLAAAPLTVAAGWIIYSNFVIDHQVPLVDAIPAERKAYQSRGAGGLSFYSAKEAGRPLVLIHSINAAASAYEMRPLFSRFQGKRPVYALDLPGFGFSERSRRPYSPELYQTAITDFLGTQVGEPADVVALSLGCEFAARAALENPELFNSLSLVSPTGLRARSAGTRSQKAGSSGAGSVLHAIFALPFWARAFYDLIATRTSIEYFLKKSFMATPPIDLINYDYAASHQPGAEHAPLYFISGKLFTPNICDTVYEKLKVPTLALYDRDAFTSFERLQNLLAKNPFWQAVRLVPSLGLPQFEDLDSTVEVLERFWQ